MSTAANSLKSCKNKTETNQSVHWAPRDASRPKCKVYVVKLGQQSCVSRDSNIASPCYMIWFVHFLTSPVFLTHNAVAKGMSFGVRFSGALIAILFTCDLLQVWREKIRCRLEIGIEEMPDRSCKCRSGLWTRAQYTPGRDQIPLSEFHFQTECAHTWSLVHSK